MRFLLDTCVFSDVRKRRSESLMEWIYTQAVGDLAISVVTLLELERGIRQRSRKDPRAGEALREWLELDVLPTVEGRIIPVDSGIATTAARLHVPDPMPEMDALIAATALSRNLTLVTRNSKDVERTGARHLNPW